MLLRAYLLTLIRSHTNTVDLRTPSPEQATAFERVHLSVRLNSAFGDGRLPPPLHHGRRRAGTIIVTRRLIYTLIIRSPDPVRTRAGRVRSGTDARRPRRSGPRSPAAVLSRPSYYLSYATHVWRRFRYSFFVFCLFRS